MADDKKIKIHFETTADTSAADATAKAVDRVEREVIETSDASAKAAEKTVEQGKEVEQSNVKITDTSRKNTEAIQENIAAMKAWQEERRKAARLAGSSALAVDPAAMQAEESRVANERAAAAAREKQRADDEAEFARREALRKEEVAARKRQLAEMNKLAKEEARDDARGDRGLLSGAGGRKFASAAGGYVVAGAAIRTAAMEASAAVRELNDAFVAAGGTSSKAAEQYLYLMEFAMNPLKGAFKATMDLISISAKQALADLSESQGRAEEMSRKYQAMLASIQRFEKQAAKSAFESQLKRQTLEIDNQSRALERRLSLLRAERALVSAEATFEENERVRGGESPQQVAADRIVRQLNEQLAALTDEQAKAEAAVNEAIAKAYQAEDKAFNLSRSTGALSDQTIAADGEVIAANNRVKQAQEDQKRVAQEIAITQERLTIETLDTLSGESDKAKSGITQGIRESIAALEESARESGVEMNASAKGAYNTLVRILNDSIPDENQLGDIATAQQQAKSANMENANKVVQILQSVVSDFSQVTSRLSGVEKQLDAIRARGR